MAKPIYTIHSPDPERLSGIKAEMMELGAPEIKVVDCGDFYMALEGSHRIAAAHDLGIQPNMIVYNQDDVINISEFDWYEPWNWGGTTYTAGEVAGELYSPQAQVFNF